MYRYIRIFYMRCFPFSIQQATYFFFKASIPSLACAVAPTPLVSRCFPFSIQQATSKEEASKEATSKEEASKEAVSKEQA